MFVTFSMMFAKYDPWDQVTRPQPPSRLGRGNFPERGLELGPGAGDKEEYYPGLPQIATLGEIR